MNELNKAQKELFACHRRRIEDKLRKKLTELFGKEKHSVIQQLLININKLLDKE